MNDLVALAKRRGFIFQSSEIYGGMAGIYDFGPNGVELLKNIKDAWWNTMVYSRDDVDGIEAALIGPRAVWKYSGHEGTFSDPLVICKKCAHRMREDKMQDRAKCDKCGSGELNEPRIHMLMMGLGVGVTEPGEVNAYLRPETATTTYTNFRNVLDSSSRKLPFGLVQIGKAFRNEISPRNFVFRLREFQQMELQYFINPKDDDMKCWEDWRDARMKWWTDVMGIPKERLRFALHENLAHYAKAAGDIEYEFPDGFDEIEGIHNRQDYDLGSHTKGQGEFKIQATVMDNKDSVQKLNYTDAQSGENFIPFCIETAAGLERAMLTVLLDAYTDEDLGDCNSRIVLKLKPKLSPIKAAVIPLARNVPALLETSEKIAADLRALGLGRIVIENSGNIGKNYRRHDEIGTPVCITVDHQSLEDGMATLRDRDTMTQQRVKIADIPEKLKLMIV